MDRHVVWLRRRIIASIAAQSAATFAVVAVVTAALIIWRTDLGFVAALPAAFVIAQIVAFGRVAHALRANPLTHHYVQSFVDAPFRYRVERFVEDPHEDAFRLSHFFAVATIRDSDRDPSPIVDVLHTEDRIIAACVSRASGAITLLSSLADGRLLVTDGRVIPPSERLVINVASSTELSAVLEAHLRAVTARGDVVALVPSAHQVALELLELEAEAYRGLGPWLAPFLDLEPNQKSWTRLIARVTPAELEKLASAGSVELTPRSTLQWAQSGISRALS